MGDGEQSLPTSAFGFAARLRSRMIEKQIEAINVEVGERMRPLQPALDLIDQLPGIAQPGAEQIIAALGST